ncbi:hypothetical protein Tco_0721763 [Tanacetum coccineum]
MLYIGLLCPSVRIDLNVPVKLGRFDASSVWIKLAKYHAVIICDEKIVRIPYGDEMLIIRGDDCDSGSKSKLNIISCTKTHKYIQKGCQVYLAQVTSKKTEDKSEESNLDVANSSPGIDSTSRNCKSRIQAARDRQKSYADVHWNLRRGPEFTWELEDQMQKKYPHLFANPVSASNATS